MIRLMCLFCALTALIPAASAESVYRDNVVVVLDASGSMESKMQGLGRTRMDVAQESLQTVLAQVPAETNVGLFVFSGKQSKRGWLYELAPLNTQRMQEAIAMPIPGGRTPLGASLLTCANQLLEQRTAQNGYGNYRLLVVTDGEASDGEMMEAVIPQVLARGVTLDVIGLDMAQSHTLATKVHSYRDARNPRDLTQALQESFAEISADDQNVQQEYFSVVSALDADLAGAAIAALGASGNQPIVFGAQPTEKPQPVASTKPSGGSAQSAPAPEAEGGFSIWMIAIGGFIVFFVLRSFKGAR